MMLFRMSLPAIMIGLGLSSAAVAQGTADWEGLYLGATVGYGSSSSYHCDGVDCLGGSPTFPETDPSGAVGGVTVGYNFASTNNWVLGVEADLSASGMSGSSPSTASYGCGAECTTDIDSFATLRFRAGYATGMSLIYGTLGVAATRYTNGISGRSSSTTESSAVIGIGLEHAINSSWSVKGEALYVDDPGVITFDSACAAPGCSTDDNGYSVVRFGVNYRY